jgi:hypothetical protein
MLVQYAKMREKRLLEAAVCKEPAHAAVLQEGTLLDPVVTDKSDTALVHPLNEVWRKGCHRAPERENEWEWLFEIE